MTTPLELLKRIRQWDHLDGAGDGPFWKKQIDECLAAHEAQASIPDETIIAYAIAFDGFLHADGRFDFPNTKRLTQFFRAVTSHNKPPMQVKDFPSVKEAKKLAQHQLKFYNEMMGKKKIATQKSTAKTYADQELIKQMQPFYEAFMPPEDIQQLMDHSDGRN
jgi:hypothetical protein